MRRRAARAPAPAPRIGRIRELRGAPEDYLRELHTRFGDLDLSGLDVLLDCANGATYHVAPEIFRRLGANVTGDRRRARRAQHQRRLRLDARRARSPSASSRAATTIGFAFDGDGDRVLAVDRAGEVVDGDELLALAALHLRDSGRLPGDGVVVTVMTNYGFHTAMERAGIEVATHEGRRPLRARGAARARLDARRRAVRPHHRDGLQPHRRRHRRRAADARGARPGATWASATRWQKLPQRLVNVRVRDRDALDGADGVEAGGARGRAAARGRGRVLVRPSGTEPLVRVMVEAPTRRGGRGRLRAPRRARRARAGVEPRRRPGRRAEHRWYLRAGVRHRRLRRQAPGPGAAARGPAQARVPRL